jgi:hypothetical protein
MIKPFIYTAFIFLAATGCNSNTPAAENTTAVVPEKKDNFFPVTTYLKGQLYEIKQKGVSPFKYTVVNGRIDSAIIKLDEVEAYAKEFLEPVIDTANLFSTYTESKFLDKTIDAFTFTYEPANPANDSLLLRHWDVYVEPETGKVKRVYIVKKGTGNKTLQLTWLPDEYFKTVVLNNNTNGTTTVEKEEKISWNY